MIIDILASQRFAFVDSGAGVDSAWEQEKLEARKMLAAGAAESPASSAPQKMGERHHFYERNKDAMLQWREYTPKRQARKPSRSTLWSSKR